MTRLRLAALHAALAATMLTVDTSCRREDPSGSKPAAAQKLALSRKPSLEVLKVNDFTSGPNTDFNVAERISAVAPLPDEGILATTQTHDQGSQVYKLSNSGTVIWRRSLPIGSFARSAGISGDGSYWVAGNLDDGADGKLEYGTVDFTSRIAPDGSIGSPVILSGKNESRYLRCTIKVGDEFVQADSDSSQADYLHLLVPRISKIDGAGHLIWQHYVAFDQGRRMMRDFGSQTDDCAGLFSGKDRHIFAAERTLVFPESMTEDQVYEVVTRHHGSAPRSATMLLALDSRGHVLSSTRHDNTSDALMTQTPDGPILFETIHERGGPYDVRSVVGQRLIMRKFDWTLKEIGSPAVFGDTNFDRVLAAYPTPGGGVLIYGCSGDNRAGPVYFRYITATLATSAKIFSREFGVTCGGVIQFAPGTQGDQALVVLQTPQQGNRVMTLRYSD